MSLLTGKYFEMPSYEGHEHNNHKPDREGKRRFFQSAARWDEGFGRVLSKEDSELLYQRTFGLGRLMERGGRKREFNAVDGDGEDVEEEWDDMIGDP